MQYKALWWQKSLNGIFFRLWTFPKTTRYVLSQLEFQLFAWTTKKNFQNCSVSTDLYSKWIDGNSILFVSFRKLFSIFFLRTSILFRSAFIFRDIQTKHLWQKHRLYFDAIISTHGVTSLVNGYSWFDIACINFSISKFPNN